MVIALDIIPFPSPNFGKNATCYFALQTKTTWGFLGSSFYSIAQESIKMSF